MRENQIGPISRELSRVSPSLSRLRDWRILACGIFVIALAIRAVFWMQWEQTPYGPAAILDSAYFDQQAVAISNGQWLPDRVFYVPPAYQYILAVTYKAFGHSLSTVRLLQNLLGSVNCLLIALIAGRVFGINAGLVAGLVAALYRPFIFYDSMILKTTWDLLFTALFCIYAIKTTAAPRIKDAALSGIFLGIAILLRGNMIFLIPCLPVWWLCGAKRAETSGSSNRLRTWFRSNRNRLRLLLAYGLGIAICILPITASNYFIGHDLVLTGYSSGPNLWFGNNAETTGVLVYPADMTTQDGNMEGEEAYFRSRAEQEMGRVLKPSEISRFWIGKAKEFVFTHPLDWARLTARKMLLFWNNHEVSDNYDLRFLRQEFHTVLNGPLLSFGLVAPWAAVGIFSAFRRRNREAILLLALSAVYVPSTLPFIIVDRYRLPLLVALIPFAAHGVMDTVRDFRAGNSRHLRVSGMVLAAVAMLCWAPLFATDMGLDANYTNLGSVYLEQNNLPKARHYFEKAVAVAPECAPALNNLGGVLFIMGEREKGLALTRKAIATDPNFANGYATLGQMQTTLHDYQGAIQSYQSALVSNPAFAQAYQSLGRLYSTIGNSQAAAENFQRALTLDPTLAEARGNPAPPGED